MAFYFFNSEWFVIMYPYDRVLLTSVQGVHSLHDSLQPHPHLFDSWDHTEHRKRSTPTTPHKALVHFRYSRPWHQSSMMKLNALREACYLGTTFHLFICLRQHLQHTVSKSSTPAFPIRNMLSSNEKCKTAIRSNPMLLHKETDMVT